MNKGKGPIRNPHAIVGTEREGRFAGEATLILMGEVPGDEIEKYLSGVNHVNWEIMLYEPWEHIRWILKRGKKVTIETLFPIRVPEDIRLHAEVFILYRCDDWSALQYAHGVKIETARLACQWSLLTWQVTKPSDYRHDKTVWGKREN